ncbi:heterokaryon incompatibility protein 6 [Xylariales sp. PMI_506]|nr:heterokaryon incompatibility protein 6 [Xylariales sp. PMI_506]
MGDNISRGKDGSEGVRLAQMLSTIVTSQNSCPLHEQCDSSCPRRIGVRQYRLMPDGERRDEIDMRAQLASMRLESSSDTLPAERTEPLGIPENTPRFAYWPLQQPSTMIRLLKIRPALLRADPVDCELVHANIANAPPYGALSYCWGTGPDDRKLLCNGTVFYARASLERALKRLRAGIQQLEREEYIWADAICINQQDLEEKGAQVRLMEHIYSGAKTVYVDLGDTQGYTMAYGGFTMVFSGQGGGMGAPDALTYSSDPSHPLHYKTAFQALNQPWFTRTWIIQEVALARHVKYMFQGNVFTQDHLDSILSKSALQANPGRMQELMAGNNAVTMRAFLNYSKIQQIKAARGSMDSLHLIQLTRDFDVTNPEDKIFGLFALMSEADRATMGPYSRAVGDVYRRFAALQVQRGRTIWMLDNAGIQRQKLPRGTVPSWVPDWTGGSSGQPISKLRPVPYGACGPNTAAEAHLVEEKTSSWPGRSSRGGLSLRGVLVDRLEKVTRVATAPMGPFGEPDFMTFHGRFRATFDELCRNGRSTYTDGLNAFARLLLMDDCYTGGNAILHSTPILDPAATYQMALAAWRAGWTHHHPRRGEGGRMDAVQTFQMQATTTCPGRAFATTHDGFMGLVPHLTQPGDVVAVLFGSTVPHVLRDVGKGCYMLIGDAFVHGMMYGEVFRRRNVKPVDILLV